MKTISRDEMMAQLKFEGNVQLALIVAAIVAAPALTWLGFFPLWLGALLLGGTLYVLFFKVKTIRDPNRVVILDGEVADFGAESFVLPAFTNFETRWYPPKPYLESEAIKLPTREGRYLDATCHVTWKPDPSCIHIFVAAGEEMREMVKVRARALLQAWSVGKTVGEVYASREFPELTVEGAIVLSLDVTDLVQDFSGHTNVPPDFREEIKSVIRHAETAAQLSAMRAMLEAQHPGEAAFIKVLCEDWLNKIREGNLR